MGFGVIWVVFVFFRTFFGVIPVPSCPPQGLSLLGVRAQALLQYLGDLGLLLATKCRGGALGALPALPRLLETRLVRGRGLREGAGPEGLGGEMAPGAGRPWGG